MSDFTITQTLVSQAIMDIFIALRPSERVPKVTVYEDIARRLNTLAGGESWSWRYVASTATGSAAPSRKFSHAVMSLAAVIDGIPEHIAGARAEELYIQAGVNVRPGALVQLASKPCGWHGCRVWIVSRSGYCCPDHRRLARNERARQRRQEAR